MKMADQNQEDINKPNPEGEKTDIRTPEQKDKDMVAKLVQDGIDAALKPIKEKLDSAHAKREAAEKKVEEFEAKERAANLKRLEEEGKHKEAFELQLAEERAARKAAEEKAIKLSRDVDVRTVLSTQNFRNDKALEMAYSEVVGQLVQNESGVWIHRSGVSVKDFVKTFADDESNAFLFKQKVSSGGGSGPAKPGGSGDTAKKSIFEYTQAEVLKMAEEGKLRKR
jgi:hypothetical protein